MGVSHFNQMTRTCTMQAKILLPCAIMLLANSKVSPHHTITSKLRAYTIHWDQLFWTVRLFSSEAKDAFSTIGEGPEGFFPLFGAPIGGEGLVEGGIYWRGASIGGGHLLNWRGASIGRGRLSEGSVY